ncbi:hypothetical protein [Microbaculum marinum]|uniref:Uncharacterized protein n=1 Tax=Microbaculum marinum TaxID=1764581 RepID=A0AAW9RJX4_9HYPH
MQPHDTEDPIARAFGYPYPRHPGPVLFDPATGAHEAHVVDIGPEREHAVAGLARPLPARAVAVRVAGQTIEIDDAVALVAAGSNGSTVQLARKYRERRSARPTLIAPATVRGAVSVYSAHITSYGSVPATMHGAGGASADLHVLLLPAEELAHINATESLGVNYVLAAPHGTAATIEAVTLSRPLAYVSKRGALSIDGSPSLLAGTGGRDAGYPAADQREMMARVQRHVGDAGALEEFVRAMIADRQRRLAVTALLAETAEPWMLEEDEIVGDGTQA